ncbi:MAG: rhomboid family protein [Spartobacteria bacterium]|nr:rhomboid family protein [Spartobacteria bacterium]
MDIARQRCFNHQQREAVARCPVCERFFCRECITEHDDRVICVACLHALMAARKPTRSIVRHGKTAAQCLAAFLLLWLLFFSIGQLLLRIPGSFHEGTLWNEWWD